MQNRIKEYRLKKLLSQNDLALKSGVSRVTISMLESGKSETASTKTLVKIAKALDTNVATLFFLA